MVGPLQAFEQVTAAVRIECLLGQPAKRGVFETIEVFVLAQRLLRERDAGDCLGVEAGWQMRTRTERVTLMVQPQLESPDQKLKRLVGMIGVREQRLPRLDFADACRIVETLDPNRQKLFDPRELLRVLEMQAVVVIVVLGPGDKLLQCDRAIGRQRKLFDITDLARHCRSCAQRGERQHDQKGSLHGSSSSCL